MERIGFAVNSAGVALELAYSEDVSAAYDLLLSGGLTPERAAQLAVNAERAYLAGIIRRHPVDFAEHFLSVARAAKGLS